MVASAALPPFWPLPEDDDDPWLLTSATCARCGAYYLSLLAHPDENKRFCAKCAPSAQEFRLMAEQETAEDSLRPGLGSEDPRLW